jgi:hypothetical protein
MGRLVARFRLRVSRRTESDAAVWDRPRTVAKMLAFSVLPGYLVEATTPARPKLDPFTGVIDRNPGGRRSSGMPQNGPSERLRDELAMPAESPL